MGQSSISLLNKVGYSMFWSSMWDHKIYYNRFLKEDIFLNKFIALTFNDSLTINFFNFKKKQTKYFKNYNYSLDFKRKSIYNFILNKNKVHFCSSKLWVLKYQNWIIIYQFIYFLNNNNLKKELNQAELKYKSNYSFLIKFYTTKNCSFVNKYNVFKSKIVKEINF